MNNVSIYDRASDVCSELSEKQPLVEEGAKLHHIGDSTSSTQLVSSTIHLDLSQRQLKPDDIITLCAPYQAITSLNVSGNGLSELPVPAALFHLERLDLSRNELTSTSLRPLFDAGCFDKLYSLNLAGNQIDQLPDTFHASLPHLETLDVTDNQLQRLPTCIGLLDSLTALSMDGNPWDPMFKDLWNSMLTLPKRLSKVPELPSKLVKKNRRISSVEALSGKLSEDNEDAASDASGDERGSLSPTRLQVRARSMPIGAEYASTAAAAAILNTTTPTPSRTPITSEPEVAVSTMGVKWLVAYLRDLHELDPANYAMPLTSQMNVPVIESTSTRACSADSEEHKPLTATIREDSEKLAQRRSKILNELLSTEEAYVGYLQTVFDVRFYSFIWFLQFI
jgi:hypothetical protein